jgi:hypothetical protein
MTERSISFWESHKILSWIKDNRDWLVGWVVGLAITSSISFIIAFLFQNSQWVWVIISLLFVALILGFVVLGNYFAHRFNELFKLSSNLEHSTNYYRQLLCDKGSVAQDVTLKTLTKRVIFDKSSIEQTGNCETNIEWVIQNNMTEEYNKLYFFVQSHVYVPPFEDFKFFRSDMSRNVSIDKISTKFEHIEHSAGEPGSTDRRITKVEDNMYLPVQIPPNETRTIKLVYRTGAYKPAFLGERDHLQVKINRVTEKLLIEIILDNDAKKVFKIVEVEQPRSDSLERYEFEIQDESRVRMKNSESQLNGKPSFQKDKLVWEIFNPKIGYSYKVYFTLKRI